METQIFENKQMLILLDGLFIIGIGLLILQQQPAIKIPTKHSLKHWKFDI